MADESKKLSENDETLLILGVLGALGYWLWRKNQAAAQTLPPSSASMYEGPPSPMPVDPSAGGVSPGGDAGDYAGGAPVGYGPATLPAQPTAGQLAAQVLAAPASQTLPPQTPGAAWAQTPWTPSTVPGAIPAVQTISRSKTAPVRIFTPSLAQGTWQPHAVGLRNASSTSAPAPSPAPSGPFATSQNALRPASAPVLQSLNLPKSTLPKRW